MAEWTCESCVHYPPSSFGGKPCWMCNTNDPLLNRYEKRADIDADIPVYDKEEIYENCTVQVLTNTETGEVSVGWWQNE